MNWIFVTASFGGQNFHDSAKRLLSQAESFQLFASLVHVTEENLSKFAPRVTKEYVNILNSTVPGYGYFTWKSEITDTILRMNPKSGVCYVDAGCELNLNFFTRKRLEWMLRSASSGTFLHVLNYPEYFYTKKKVIDFFKLNTFDSMSSQFQATWFMLSGAIGREISKRWLDASLSDLTMIDDSVTSESPEFVCHRYDQSIFSCVLKSLKIKPKRHRPCYRPLTPLSRVNCYFHPIWSARNRTGQSIQGHR